MQIPETVRNIFSIFPLHTYPAIPPPPSPGSSSSSAAATLWIAAPPSSTEVLSADVECLKWQAYLALRGVSPGVLNVRTDVDPQAALEGQFPNLRVNDKLEQEEGSLLPAYLISAWTDAHLGVSSLDDSLEGYRDETARDESRAWVALLEGNVHSALILAKPQPSLLVSMFSFSSTIDPRTSIHTKMSPPIAPLTGILSVLPSYGSRVPEEVIYARYAEAINALSDRLGKDKWFLGSASPTPLDALVFAYLHCLLQSDVVVRFEVTKRVNLVAWELRVRTLVQAVFSRQVFA